MKWLMLFAMLITAAAFAQVTLTVDDDNPLELATLADYAALSGRSADSLVALMIARPYGFQMLCRDYTNIDTTTYTAAAYAYAESPFGGDIVAAQFNGSKYCSWTDADFRDTLQWRDGMLIEVITNPYIGTAGTEIIYAPCDLDQGILDRYGVWQQRVESSYIDTPDDDSYSHNWKVYSVYMDGTNVHATTNNTEHAPIAHGKTSPYQVNPADPVIGGGHNASGNADNSLSYEGAVSIVAVWHFPSEATGDNFDFTLTYDALAKYMHIPDTTFRTLTSAGGYARKNLTTAGQMDTIKIMPSVFYHPAEVLDSLLVIKANTKNTVWWNDSLTQGNTDLGAVLNFGQDGYVAQIDSSYRVYVCSLNVRNNDNGPGIKFNGDADGEIGWNVLKNNLIGIDLIIAEAQDTIEVYHNTIVGPGSDVNNSRGVRSSAYGGEPGGELIVTDNIVTLHNGTASYGYQNVAATKFSYGHTLFYLNTSNTNGSFTSIGNDVTGQVPQFVDATSLNFYLKAISPAFTTTYTGGTYLGALGTEPVIGQGAQFLLFFNDGVGDD